MTLTTGAEAISRLKDSTRRLELIRMKCDIHMALGIGLPDQDRRKDFGYGSLAWSLVVFLVWEFRRFWANICEGLVVW